MKAHILAAALGLFAFAAAPALAQSGHMHHSHAAAPAAGQAMTEGVVKKVDKAAAKLTIAHAPLEHLGMPAMTMAFPVRNAAQLDTLKAGDKIRFRAEQHNGSIVVTAVETAK